MALANRREEPFGSFSAGKTYLLSEMQRGKKTLHLTHPPLFTGPIPLTPGFEVANVQDCDISLTSACTFQPTIFSPAITEI